MAQIPKVLVVAPLLSHCAQFLPFRQVFRTLVVVCTYWTQVRFTLKHVKLGQREIENMPCIVRHLDVTCVKFLEIYARPGRAGPEAAKYFTNAKCLLVSTVGRADYSPCTSVKHLFVLKSAGVARGLPPNLKSLTQRDALQNECLSKLSKLRHLGGQTSVVTKPQRAALECLQVDTAYIDMFYNRALGNNKFPQGWSFAFELDAGTASDFFQYEMDLFHAVRHLNLDISALSLEHFEACGNLPNLESLWLTGMRRWNGKDRGRWLNLKTLTMDVVASDVRELLWRFIDAPVLHTLEFQGYNSPLSLPSLPHVRAMYTKQCGTSFIETLPLANVEFLGIESDTYKRTGLGFHQSVLLRKLHLPTYCKKIAVRTKHWDVHLLQTFLSKHSFSEASFALEEGKFVKIDELVVAPGTTIVLSSDLEDRFVCRGSVHFQDSKRFSRFGNDVVAEFDACIKQFQ